MDEEMEGRGSEIGYKSAREKQRESAKHSKPDVRLCRALAGEAEVGGKSRTHTCPCKEEASPEGLGQPWSPQREGRFWCMEERSAMI